jgi:hypothetical protein
VDILFNDNARGCDAGTADDSESNNFELSH